VSRKIPEQLSHRPANGTRLDNEGKQCSTALRAVIRSNSDSDGVWSNRDKEAGTPRVP